jgi:hypothetical protein
MICRSFLRKNSMRLFIRTRQAAMFAAAFLICVRAADAAPLTLGSATTLAHQTTFGNVDQTIDGNTAGGNGMGFEPFQTNVNIIAWEVTPNASGPGLLTLQIRSDLGSSHTLQRFRFSATDASQALFADGNPPNGGNSPPGDVWPAPGAFTLLSPISATATNGATLTVNADGFITASGTNPSTSVYTITAQSPLANITGLRLEVQPQGSGAANYIGRAANGNATITEFTADFTPGGNYANGLQQQVLQNATATFNQANFNVSEAIDGIVLEPGNNGWATFGATNVPQTAVFQVDKSIAVGDVLIQLDFASAIADHKLQQFRLSYTKDPNPTVTSGATWTTLDPSYIDTSRLDSTAIELAGNIVQITGNGVNDFVSIFIDDLGVSGITGFRLEALPGPNGQLGFTTTTGNGNFVLSEFQVFATLIPEPASVALWSILGMGFLVAAGHSLERRKHNVA